MAAMPTPRLATGTAGLNLFERSRSKSTGNVIAAIPTVEVMSNDGC